LKSEKPISKKFQAVLMALLSVIYLVLYSVEVLVAPRGDMRNAIEVISNFIWIIFAVDFVIRFIQAQVKLQFMKENFLELLSLVLPAIRTLRMFRVVTAFSQMSVLAKNAQYRFNFMMASALPLIYYMCALGILDAERDAPGAKILNFGDSLWWSLTTIATVGYGDLYPVTASGRIIASILMFTGLGFMSLITANIASWFLKNYQNAQSGD
jgi:voltage-gated potassium channel